MRTAAQQTAPFDPHYAAFGEEGGDPRDPELHRLLEREVHALSLGHAEPQMHPQGQRRLTLDRDALWMSVRHRVL